MFKYCWGKYTMHVLTNCQAELILLVGTKSKRLFCQIINDTVMQSKLDDKGVIDIELAGKNRKIAWLRHFSNGWSEKIHLPSVWFNDEVFQCLKNSIKNC
ncbi:MAG: hypothetical protein FWE49_02395 [Synergistaceae bacterium]|nr:hypothetical protein [Synergistaceae bacterium]